MSEEISPMHRTTSTTATEVFRIGNLNSHMAGWQASQRASVVCCVSVLTSQHALKVEGQGSKPRETPLEYLPTLSPTGYNILDDCLLDHSDPTPAQFIVKVEHFSYAVGL